MNSKRIGVSFLLQMVFYYLLVFGLTIYMIAFPAGYEMEIVENLIVSQLVNVVPVMLVIRIGRRKYRGEKIFRDILGFRRINGPYDSPLYVFTDAIDNTCQCNIHDLCG